MLIPLWSYLRKLAGTLAVTGLLDEASQKMASTAKVAEDIRYKFGLAESSFEDALDYLASDIEPQLKEINKTLKSFVDEMDKISIKNKDEKSFIPRLEGLANYAKIMHKLFKKEEIQRTEDKRPIPPTNFEYKSAFDSLKDLHKKLGDLQNQVLKLKFQSATYS